MDLKVCTRKDVCPHTFRQQRTCLFGKLTKVLQKMLKLWYTDTWKTVSDPASYLMYVVPVVLLNSMLVSIETKEQLWGNEIGSVKWLIKREFRTRTGEGRI